MSDGELMVLFGPPAVGKMTVGRAVCDRTDFRLFLNHHTIEPLSEIFGMDSTPFRALTSEFRRRIVEEAAAERVALILTLVWNLDGTTDARWVSDLVSPYVDAGLPVSFVELSARLETRLERNRGADRLRDKPSKRDLVWSEAHLRERENWVMNTGGSRPLVADRLLVEHRHLKVDNEGPDPDAAADLIAGWHATN